MEDIVINLAVWVMYVNELEFLRIYLFLWDLELCFKGFQNINIISITYLGHYASLNPWFINPGKAQAELVLSSNADDAQDKAIGCVQSFFIMVSSKSSFFLKNLL